MIIIFILRRCSIDRRENRFVRRMGRFTSIRCIFYPIDGCTGARKTTDGWEMVCNLLFPLIARRSHWWQLWLSNHLVAGYLVFLLTLAEGSHSIYPFRSHPSVCVHAFAPEKDQSSISPILGLIRNFSIRFSKRKHDINGYNKIHSWWIFCTGRLRMRPVYRARTEMIVVCLSGARVSSTILHTRRAIPT